MKCVVRLRVFTFNWLHEYFEKRILGFRLSFSPVNKVIGKCPDIFCATLRTIHTDVITLFNEFSEPFDISVGKSCCNRLINVPATN